MKAIILAAGKGSRLRPHTANVPKCMIDINGKTMLHRIIDTFNSCGVTDISVVRGYKKEKINYPNITYYDNPDFETTEQMSSLFCAESAMDDGFIVCFSDILFDKSVLERLLSAKSQIAVVVDTDWMEGYKDRKDHPMSQADKVVIEHGRIFELGKNIPNHKATGEFIGLAKFSANGAKFLKASKNRYSDRSYIYHALQQLAYLLIEVTPVLIKGGWREIDTCEDLEKARSLFKKKRHQKEV